MRLCVPRGFVPQQRSGHVAAAALGDMYVYGGYFKGPGTEKCLTDLCRFHVLTGAWEPVATTGPAPITTCSQSMVADEASNHLLVFGGTSLPFGITNSNTLHALNLATRCWAEVEPRSADRPSKRFGQSMVLVGVVERTEEERRRRGERGKRGGEEEEKRRQREREVTGQ